MSAQARQSAALLVLVLAAAATLAGVALAQSGSTGDRPDCVTVTGSARWNAAGYNHSVNVVNGCDYAVHCTVATDVSPVAVSVDLDAGASRSVTTFLDAPGSGFVPNVACSR